MVKGLLGVLCAALLLVSVVPAAQAGDGRGSANASGTMCRNTYGGDVISASGVGCRKARQVVRAWGRGFKRDRRVSRMAFGYRCSGRSDSVEGLTVRCRRGRASIRFYANVP